MLSNKTHPQVIRGLGFPSHTYNMTQLPANYNGQILIGPYSKTLQERTYSAIQASHAFDKVSFPLMPYITAWNHQDNNIWYEFAGQRFIDLFQATSKNISTLFKNSVKNQRIFHYSTQSQSPVEEKILTSNQLSDNRRALREDVQQSKEIEAVYQVILPSKQSIWLKDSGNVEIFPEDNISLTFGCLTDVSKEMEQKIFLEKIGYFDDLTNLPKRTILGKLFEIRTGERNRGYFQEFSVLMIDIDHFKAVNDTYGHQTGDYILKEIASIMTSIKRKEENIGRYGGEEFYGICRGDLQCGTEFAERIRQHVENHIFCHNNTDIRITISVGVASTEDVNDISMNTLLALADKRLYQAKHQGRNRVVGVP